jgi:hypothetical protein
MTTMPTEDIALIRSIHEHYTEADGTITGVGAKYAAIDVGSINASLGEFLGQIAADMDRPVTVDDVMMSVGVWLEAND